VIGLSSDQPIKGPGEDVLDRGPLVEILKDEIQAAPTSDGFVMALTAPWGEGKTSVLNLIARKMGDEAVVIRFNPWLFSDTEALVVRFFSELGAQVQKDQSLRRVGKRLLSYGQTVAPLTSIVLGPAANVAGQSLAALAAVESRSVLDEREKLKDALLQRERRLLVLIDDIDRLHPNEILDVFRLVKLVGDLPYVTYLLAFDRPYVEDALGKERQVGGRSYLEKVVQVSFDLPAIRPTEIQAVLLEKLNAVVEPLDHLAVNQERWSDLLGRGIAPFFRNLRDVARYVSGVSTRVRLLGREVALEDILALETLRVFEPQVHQLLPNLVEALTKQRSELFVNEEAAKERDREQLDHLVAQASDDRQTQVKCLLSLLFPQAFESLFGGSDPNSGEARASRRVAYAPALRAYLHASIDPGSASFATVTESIEAFGEPEKLRALLNGLDTNQLQDLVERLPDFKARIDPTLVLAGVPELLRLQRRMSDEWEGLKPAPQIFLKRAIFQTLGRLPEGDDRENAIRHAYEIAELDSERYSLIVWFGSHPERERRQPDVELVSEAVTRELEEDLRSRLQSRKLSELMAEDDFAWLVLHAFGNDAEGRRKLDELADEDAALALLRTCVAMSMEGHSLFNLQKAERYFERAALQRRVDELGGTNLTAADREILEMAKEAMAEPADVPSHEEDESASTANGADGTHRGG